MSISGKRAVTVLGTLLAVGSALALVSCGTSSKRGTGIPLRALSRRAVASDALQYKPGFFVGRVLVSRRVASYTDHRGFVTNLFIYEARGRFARQAGTQEVWFCMAYTSQRAGGGSGCSRIQDASASFSNHPLDWSYGENDYDGENFYGIATDDVRSVVLTAGKGVRYHVALSADNGFIYDCLDSNGCPGSITAIDAYGQRGQLLSSQRVHPLG
jgi:hypothetical protein